MLFSQAQVIEDGRALALTFCGARVCQYHALWLYDNAPTASQRSLSNKQKLTTAATLPLDIIITSVQLDAVNGAVKIQFDNPKFEATFDQQWLQDHAYAQAHATPPGWLPRPVHTWDQTLRNTIPTATFDSLCTDSDTLYEWLCAFNELGVATVTQGPLRSGALLELVAQFGFVRETNYGKWFEVRSEAAPSNLAYTNVALQAHTDNPYRDPTPTMQLLYCLQDAGEGGESVVIDGFHVARVLRDEAPAHFELLSSYCARFEYSGSTDVHLQARRPIIELAADGELRAIRFNNRSIAPLVDVPYNLVPNYYRALKHFSEVVDRRSSAVRFKLLPGDAFMVDNTRVLHGRAEFSNTGARWLQGCYPDLDGLRSTIATMRRNALPHSSTPRRSA